MYLSNYNRLWGQANKNNWRIRTLEWKYKPLSERITDKLNYSMLFLTEMMDNYASIESSIVLGEKGLLNVKENLSKW